ncbi:MAG: Cna B-type domain-containing protein, partial [Oscillospiraceae bacterium]
SDNVKLSLYANGEKVDGAVYRWTDNGDNTWSYIFANLPKKDENGVIDYTVKEDAVDGYFAKYDGNNITNVYNVTNVSGEKTWDDDSDIAGVRPTALRVILSANGNVTNNTAVWEKNGNKWSYTFSNLAKYDGNGELIKYTVEETVPDGYVQSAKSADGLSFTNKATSVQILKVDESGQPLAGASLSVLDQNDNVVDSWVSGSEAHEIAGLKVGATYTLKETRSPNGYTIAADKDFTIPASGVVQVKMTDGITKVKVTKTASDTGRPLAGAVLQLKDSAGNVVDEWTTTATNNPYEFNGRLIAGAEYTIHEVSAPEGYKVADDIKFTVNTNGMVNDLIMSDTKIETEDSSDDSSDAESSSEVVSEVESSEAESSEVESSEAESSEVESSEVESSEVESSEAESSGVESSEAEFSQVESSEVEASEVESSEAESSEVESSAAESSEAESSEVESSDVDSSDVDSSSTMDSSSSSSASSSAALTTGSKASDASSSKTPDTGLAGGAFATVALALAAVVATKRKNSKDE